MIKDSNINKIKYTRSLPHRQVRHYSSNTCSQNIGSSLAGLIEDHGHIAVHDKNSKSKVYRPKIIIVFHINDRPLTEILPAAFFFFFLFKQKRR